MVSNPSASPCKTLALKGHAVRSYNDFTLNLYDVQFCQRMIFEYKTAMMEKPSDLGIAIWIAVLTKFFSCFGTSESRRTLDAKKAFKNDEAGKLLFYRMQDVRNKHIVHNENSMTQSNAVIQIVDNFLPNEFKSIAMGFNTIISQDIDNMELLVLLTINYITTEINKLVPIIQNYVEKLTWKDVNELEEWRYDAHKARFEPGKNRDRID